MLFWPNDSVCCFCLAYQATGCPTPALEGKRTLHYISPTAFFLGMGIEGPLGGCLCTDQAAWGEEGEGTHVSMSLVWAGVGTCMDHLKGMQGPRKMQGFLRCLQPCPCAPWRGAMEPKQGATSHMTRFLPILGFHGFCNHLCRFDILLSIFSPWLLP